MAKREQTRYAFNRGLISPLALGRVDLKRTALSAETQTNWMPRTLGSMMLRPGTQYLGRTASDAQARYIPFIRSPDDMYLLEFTAGAMRVWMNEDDTLLTRAAVSSAVTNGNFTANLAGWTDNDEAGAVSAWVAGGYMGLTGTGTNAAIRDQEVTVAPIDQGIEHALRIVIERGPVMIRVGSALAGDSYIGEATLFTGTHSLAFTPTGASFFIRFFSRLKRIVLVDSCNVEASGVVSVTAPYQAVDLDYIRADTQSLSIDVMFAACKGRQQRRFERRADGRSWSVVLYQPEDGPFRLQNTSTQTMTPSTLAGNGTLTSSVPFFVATHVGALFSLSSTGQTVQKSMTALNDATASIRVIGVGTDRAYTIVLTGLTGTGNTVILQRSFDNTTWVAVAGKTWAANTTESYNDTLDNQIVYYRLLCTVYAAGTTVANLTISTGSITGVARVTGYTSNLVVDIEILADFGATDATDTWSEGLWSDYRGWPSAGTLYEGRMNWDGFDQIVLSVSDEFDGFDPETVGDSGPINRTIGAGPMDTINWALPLERLIIGSALAEHSLRSSALDEPLTPSNFNRKAFSTQGSAPVPAQKVDGRGIFVQRGGNRVFAVEPDPQGTDYHSVDLTELNPEVCRPKVVRIAVQRRPDTRAHCVLSDGTVACLVYDHAEEVKCWIKVTIPGSAVVGDVITVEDVVVLPGVDGSYEDQVYYQIKFDNGSTVSRFLLKWALETECAGGIYNKQADSFIITGAGLQTVTGLDHLNGTFVVVWGNGKWMPGTWLPHGGELELDEELDANGAVIGWGYTALYKTAKLGNTISKYKNIDHIAPVLKDTHSQGLEMGQDFVTMDNLPLVVAGRVVSDNAVYTEYDDAPQEFDGKWDVDSRVCLRATAPKPCTVLALVIDGEVST